ncbi:glycosyltransferase family 4 protein [Janibacter cremeus]|uniref:Glycosyltransferase involved in cell wall biosynthesis n=1 Tax=Janibacter cremeus TaxID=1285192 RepID=A0A852VPT2_9MICO|nr:glycosyltransferase family 1 protein [Janibacter cremeus]NYF99047.1 glycosyltransferase involved in cell wall biosynthesis [Janibacter cremeus]
MTRLTIARIASDSMLGTGLYEDRIVMHSPKALPADWTVDQAVVRSLRSPLPGTHRLPLGKVASAPASARRLIGRALYPRDAVVHRMSLELPPSPHADVLTLHDVVAWKYPDESAPVPAAAEEIRRAAAVVCVSAFSAAEAVDLLGIDPPHVVHNGVDERFFDAAPATPADLRSVGVPSPFVLTTGGASERKNLAGLAAAWPLVHATRPELTLVLTGPPHPRRTALFAHLPNVVLAGLVDAGLVPHLIAAAEAVVVPSLYEGFGFPALEGMATGVPVVAANTSSLPEVVGDGALLVAPDAHSIAEGIIDATGDDPEVQRVAARGRARADHFTWERSLAGHASVWTSVAEGR